MNLAIVAMNFADYMIELYQEQREKEFIRALQIVDILVRHSDPKISELGIIGILESLQGHLSYHKINETEFVKRLTYETRLCWDSLNKF